MHICTYVFVCMIVSRVCSFEWDSSKVERRTFGNKYQNDSLFLWHQSHNHCGHHNSNGNFCGGI